ncbi:MAG: ADP-ribosylglycohydrolase family protein [Bacteroidales bacterium]
MNKIVVVILIFMVSLKMGFSQTESQIFQTISAKNLMDKIAGGWAGKMIGVTYGGPTEYTFRKAINDAPIKWIPADLASSNTQDDLYVQLAFIMAMDKYGIDVSAKNIQEMMATAGFTMWAANLQARKNYYNGIYAPLSGSPEYNYRADDIDFQIESDFIGFMNPGMIQNSINISDKIGHIMNYGDGVYGGTFVSAMESAAFFENDIERIVEKGLTAIPKESNYSKIIGDVLLLHKQYPDNWKAAWKELDDKWSEIDISGAGIDFNFDATLNGAYIVMGLLYGEGDVMKTIDISTRCGQDSDCNPANAMAVLGVVKGYRNLPKEMTDQISQIEDSTFSHTTYTFKTMVESTYNYAIKFIRKNGGTTLGEEIKIPVQSIKLKKLEVSFPDVVFDTVVSAFSKEKWDYKGNWQVWQVPHWEKDHAPIEQSMYANKIGDELEFTFDGSGIALYGNLYKYGGKADFYVDGKLHQTIDTYYDYCKQEPLDICIWHVFELKPGKHTVKVVVKAEKREESSGANICVTRAFIYKTGQKKNETYKFSFER